MPSYFLAKSEPDTYPWKRLVEEGRAVWDGVRNFAARNNLRAMKKGDKVLFYHSNEGKEIVGIAVVVREAFPDPTAKEGDWSAVELAPHKPLKKPVTLTAIKADPAFRELDLVRRSRLSVGTVSPAHYERILKLGETKG